MTKRMAIYMQDIVDIREELELARYMEERSFSEIWQGDNRLARDCIVLMSAFLTHTKWLRVASGVLPIWTRNPAVIAASFSSMWELGGKVEGQGRVMLGLGAWWEPIASRVGVNMRKPLTAMRENIEAVRQLLTMETITYQGEFVNLENVSLDVVYGDTSPRDIPIYLGATGPKMLELAGEICDGVCLNYGVSVDYIKRAISLVEKGAQKAGKTIQDVDLPELMVISMSDEDPDAALHSGKKLAAYYFATEPHIMKASGVSEEIADKAKALMGWPATEEDYERASAVIPDAIVRDIMAVGTADECRAKVKEFMDAGVTCPILYPLRGNIKEVIDAFADGV
ncbi:MAG: LLM class flavin-dependent oxidoreductase [Pseudomonadales bacterium]|jgi:5,10-methylenetetrahydromethanopterin reductase|nr:LLM class flavin-dependent oxidoreductase [Pseudomonadales bacterium]|tara:strand:- start:10371 stop:11390 length:1020 start_codon:yes stop_codon:yes gene_type:complete